MKAKRFDREELEQLLAETGEPEAPPWLFPRIMAEIEERQLPLAERLRRWWFRPQAVSFSPARLALTVVATLCAFWLGLIVGQMRPGGDRPDLAESGEANFLIGRGLLAAGKADQALPFLRQAVAQEPQTPEFAYWQGVAYWAKGETEQERQSYLASIEDKPDYLPSLLNLGHNYLETGQYQLALAQYDKVLQAEPFEASALYNRGLAYQMMEDSPRAEQAFLRYLEHHRQGKWVFRALGHLHRLGNFTFRSYRIGADRIVLNATALLAGDEAVRRQELQHLAETLAGAGESELHLVAYHQGSRQVAKAAVNELQEQLTHILGKKEQAIPVLGSWFDVAETFTDANGTDRQLATGLLIFTRSKNNNKVRNSI